MKTTHIALLLASLAVAANLSAQTITGYGVTKVYLGTQTTSGTLGDSSATPHAITAYVFGTGLTGTYSFTPTSGTQIGVPKVLTTTSTSGEFENAFSSSAALNGAYGDSAYTMTFPNNGGSGPQSSTLQAFPGDAYPEDPLITGGTWSGGLLQINNTSNHTLNFASFASFGADDSYALKIYNSSDVQVASGFWNTAGTTSFLITAGTLTAGQTYSASLQFNNNYINYDTPFAGANGSIGYTVINDFQIQAVPEPSTYAAIFGALALAGVLIHRRRRLA